MTAVQVNIKLDEPIYKRLVEFAESEGSTVSQVVRTAVYRTYPFVREKL